jgi:hypothetical protein
MADLNSIAAKRSAYQDSLLAEFEKQLREMVDRAKDRVVAKLQKGLSVTDGMIDQTPGNFRARPLVMAALTTAAATSQARFCRARSRATVFCGCPSASKAGRFSSVLAIG